MASEALIKTIEQQETLDRLSEQIQPLIRDSFNSVGPAGREVRNFLHGTWLGHPLHPVLTDVPLGAWTVALALDALDGISGRDDLAPGAAAAGLTDWQYTDGAPRRLGVALGLLNVGATALYTTSLLYRQRGARDEG